ncbi:MAG: glycosyltransferase family 2 protein [Candidatus Rokubacteria bacterium]|nr:glycosyltransferase family 2 protein [Candidatus Rokubacteria bacterium]
MPPVASIVVCVYNRARQVSACLDSLLALTGSTVEVVLVDDGSTDETPRVLDAYREAHPDRLIVIERNPQNLGVASARNSGIRVAAGEFVAFTDSDCTVDPGWLTALLQGLTGPMVAAVSGTVVDHPPRTAAERAYVGTCRISQTPWQRRALVGNNMVFRRKVLCQYLFDQSLRYGCDEDDLAWRLQSDGYEIRFAPGAIVHHNHPMTLRQYWRTAIRQGQGSARFWYKRGAYIGRDILPITLAALTLPLGLLATRLLLVPAIFGLLQLMALVYNQFALKGKNVATAIGVLPVEVVYCACKTLSVYRTLARILSGSEPEIRESKQRWWAAHQNPRPPLQP